MLFLKKVLPPPPLLLFCAKNDDVNDDVEEAAMMRMTTTRGNPMNFYLAKGRLYSFEKKTPLSLLAPAERDEERDLDPEQEQTNSALFFFNSSSSSFSSFSVMNSSSLQRNGTIEFLPRKKMLFVESQKNLKTKQQKKGI
jgi:hypothetical protein